MKKKLKDRIFAGVIILFFILFYLFNFLQPDKSFSERERRPLAKWPEFTVEKLLSGRYARQIEHYAADHVPLRESLRRIKVNLGFRVFLKKDENGFFTEGKHIIRMEYPFDSKSVSRATGLFNHIKELYLNEDNQIAVAVIPDKNAFSEELKMDYSDMEKQVKKEMPFARYISLSSLLSLDDYYYTDPHWKQTELEDVSRKLSEEMGTETGAQYKTELTDLEFRGAYKGQLPVKAGKDRLGYLWNSDMENYVVTDVEHGEKISVYAPEKAEGKDPYEFFLSGPLSVVTIENPGIKEKKELILFRDSFGSSIAPLLCSGYSKITLFDVRYISSGNLEKFADFRKSDVLFLYSASVLNHSETLRY